MTYYKNTFSYVIWACYAVVLGFAYVALMILALGNLAITDKSIVICLVCLPVVLAVGTFIMTRWCVGRFSEKNFYISEGKTRLFEIIGLVLLCGLGVYLRVMAGFPAEDSSGYYALASVTGEGIPYTTHAAEYVYMLLLRLVFTVFGNHYLAGIILQIVLQIAGALIWYQGIKLFMNKIAAFLFLAIVVALPTFINSSLVYSPNMLYWLLFGFVFMLIGAYFKRFSQISSVKWYDTAASIIVGMFAGILGYLDTMGMAFLVMFYFIRRLRDYRSEKNITEELPSAVAMQFGLNIVGYFVANFLMMYIDASSTDMNLQVKLSEWVSTFQPKGTVNIPGMIQGLETADVWMLVVVIFLLLLGLPAFWLKQKKENQMIWIFFACIVFLFYWSKSNAPGMGYEFMMITALILLFLSGIQAMLSLPEDVQGPIVVLPAIHKRSKRQKADKKKSSQNVKFYDTEDVEMEEREVDNSGDEYSLGLTNEELQRRLAQAEEEEKQRQSMSTRPVQTETPAPEKPRFIENPLPLPKKHVKKSMGYKIEVPEDKMDFDIAISAFDDFDIKD